MEHQQRETVQDFAKKLISKGFDVYITTSRKKHSEWFDNSDIYSVAKMLGIQDHKIHFTNSNFKVDYLSDNGFFMHFDDDPYELDKIDDSRVYAMDVKSKFWKNRAMEIIKDKIIERDLEKLRTQHI